ncbi:hypothetical protein EVAR_16855_1 [Eumeta japonica]|uniref:Uncharacterized protein n=1 Tax=Eumeta variegata TaxID=151549 RepID=A0A4C1V363_EUMVA|nr:hypothetical protein EVAR_16855_1 [Eumeta japonica]
MAKFMNDGRSVVRVIVSRPLLRNMQQCIRLKSNRPLSSFDLVLTSLGAAAAGRRPGPLGDGQARVVPALRRFRVYS